MNLINAIELTPNRKTKAEFDPKSRVGYQVYLHALEKGAIFRPFGNVIYFNPPLSIDGETLDRAAKICVDSIRETIRALK